MKQLELKNGIVYLDGEKVPCVKKFNIASSAEDNGIAELTICMDVRVRNPNAIELEQ